MNKILLTLFVCAFAASSAMAQGLLNRRFAKSKNTNAVARVCVPRPSSEPLKFGPSFETPLPVRSFGPYTVGRPTDPMTTAAGMDGSIGFRRDCTVKMPEGNFFVNARTLKGTLAAVTGISVRTRGFGSREEALPFFIRLCKHVRDSWNVAKAPVPAVLSDHSRIEDDGAGGLRFAWVSPVHRKISIEVLLRRDVVYPPGGGSAIVRWPVTLQIEDGYSHCKDKYDVKPLEIEGLPCRAFEIGDPEQIYGNFQGSEDHAYSRVDSNTVCAALAAFGMPTNSGFLVNDFGTSALALRDGARTTCSARSRDGKRYGSIVTAEEGDIFGVFGRSVYRSSLKTGRLFELSLNKQYRNGDFPEIALRDVGVVMKALAPRWGERLEYRVLSGRGLADLNANVSNCTDSYGGGCRVMLSDRVEMVLLVYSRVYNRAGRTWHSDCLHLRFRDRLLYEFAQYEGFSQCDDGSEEAPTRRDGRQTVPVDTEAKTGPTFDICSFRGTAKLAELFGEGKYEYECDTNGVVFGNCAVPRSLVLDRVKKKAVVDECLRFFGFSQSPNGTGRTVVRWKKPIAEEVAEETDEKARDALVSGLGSNAHSPIGTAPLGRCIELDRADVGIGLMAAAEITGKVFVRHPLLWNGPVSVRVDASVSDREKVNQLLAALLPPDKARLERVNDWLYKAVPAKAENTGCH